MAEGRGFEGPMLAEWFWIDRWMGSRAFLLPIPPRGLYREMLTQAWRRGGRLPNDHEAIQRAVGATTKEWKQLWPQVAPFWRVEGDYLVNDPQVEIYGECKARRDLYSERARKGGEAKAKNAKLRGTSSAQVDSKQRTSSQQAPQKNQLAGCTLDLDLNTHTHPPSAAGSLTGPLDGAEVCVCDGLSPSPNQGPACPQHAAQPAPQPDEDDLDAHLLAAWNRLGAEIRKRPPDRWSAKHHEAWTWLLEACDSDLKLCEQVIAEYFRLNDKAIREDYVWTINVFKVRAPGCLARIREKKDKRLRVVDRPAPKEPQGEVIPIEESKARIAELRSMLGSKA